MLNLQYCCDNIFQVLKPILQQLYMLQNGIKMNTYTTEKPLSIEQIITTTLLMSTRIGTQKQI